MPKDQGILSSFEPTRPSEKLRRWLLDYFTTEDGQDQVDLQNNTNMLEKVLHLSAIPAIADLGFEGGREAADPSIQNTANLGAAAAGLLLPKGSKRLWHGSAKTFDKFDLSKLGAGHAREQGFGHYLAKNKDLAKYYRDVLGEGKGVLYEVKFDAPDTKLVDLDSPFKGQSKYVKERTHHLLKQAAADDVISKSFETDAGPLQHKNLRQYFGDRDLAEMLQESGIPGSTYWEGTSGVPHGRNYVAHDDSILEIIKRYLQ